MPSQVVSEYFAIVAKAANGANIDGVLYPSAVQVSGKNLVLFPTDRSPDIRLDQIAFLDAREIELDSWQAVTAAVS